jgi:hypothetical protein
MKPKDIKSGQRTRLHVRRKLGPVAAMMCQPLQVAVRGRFFALREVKALGATWAVLTVLVLTGFWAILFSAALALIMMNW